MVECRCSRSTEVKEFNLTVVQNRFLSGFDVTKRGNERDKFFPQKIKNSKFTSRFTKFEMIRTNESKSVMFVMTQISNYINE